jgi:hypothetical protein
MLLAAFCLAGCGEDAESTATPRTARDAPCVVRGQVRRDLNYEVFQKGGLDEKTRLADIALIESLNKNGLPDDALHLEDVRMKSREGESFHFQVLRLSRNQTLDAFLDTLRVTLASQLPTGVVMRNEAGAAYIILDHVPTHKLLPPSAPDESPKPAAAAANATPDAAAKGRLAIVIDDLGEDAAFARKLAELPVHVSFSVWPRATHARKVARIAETHGRDVLVHQPMEPQGYPDVAPGPGALLVGMTREEIEQALDNSIACVPGAAGMNNHMGSRFTEWGPGMKVVLQRLRDKKLFYLDSLTTPKSACSRQAEQTGAPFCRRDVFLDNVAETRAILHQLKKAARLAQRKGAAVAIGHPHPQTLEALTQWAGALPEDVEVVGVSRLAR